MTRLEQIVARLVAKGQMEVSEDGLSLRVTDAGMQRFEDDVYGDLQDALIDDTLTDVFNKGNAPESIGLFT